MGEVALAIGNSLDSKKMLQKSLAGIVNALDCSAAVVFERRQASGCAVLRLNHYFPPTTGRQTVARLERIMVSNCKPGFDPQRPADLWSWGGTFGTDGYYHLFSLADYGILGILKPGGPFGIETLGIINRLAEKLARACIACRRHRQIREANARLRKEVVARKPVNRALQESEERYRTIFENAAVSIWEEDLSLVKKALDDLKETGVTDIASYLRDHPDFVRQTAETVRVKDVNTATLRLYRAEDKAALTGTVARTFGPRALDAFRGFLAAVYEQRSHFECETVNRTVVGNDINVIMSIPIPADPKKFDSILVSVMDISERKHLEAQFIHAQKMEAIGTLAGGIAHDFNNLLMAIEGFAGMILQDIDVDHPHHGFLMEIEKQVRNGARLTSQLLGYARKEHTTPTPVDLNQLIRNTAEAFGRTRRQIVIELELDDDLHPVEADPGAIEQVLFNLYVNAADAMADGGRLTLKTRNTDHRAAAEKALMPPTGHYAQIVVGDTGIGMDEATRKRIFEPFFTTKSMGRGTGLGLASVYGIIRGYGGFVEVESDIGCGSTFRVNLPASSQSLPNTKSPVDNRATLQGNHTILLVDDEAVVREVGARLLERLGCTVIAAESGREALRRYGENRDRIDLVMLDMIMPDMGGRAVYEALKRCDPAVKVLLSSGYSVSGEAGEIMRQGCNGFIQKPFNVQELVSKINQILAKDGGSQS